MVNKLVGSLAQKEEILLYFLEMSAICRKETNPSSDWKGEKLVSSTRAFGRRNPRHLVV